MATLTPEQRAKKTLNERLRRQRKREREQNWQAATPQSFGGQGQDLGRGEIRQDLRRAVLPGVLLTGPCLIVPGHYPVGAHGSWGHVAGASIVLNGASHAAASEAVTLQVCCLLMHVRMQTRDGGHRSAYGRVPGKGARCCIVWCAAGARGARDTQPPTLIVTGGVTSERGPR